MMTIKRITVICMMLNWHILISNFGQNISYTLFFPNQSTWGIFNGQGTAGAALAQSTGVASLQNCTISNNNGKSGTLSGTITEFQLVPVTGNGATYWNPLSQINGVQPCLLETFVANSSQLSQPCQSPEVILLDDQKPSTSVSQPTNTPLDQRYNLLSQATDVVFQSEYQQLYETLRKDLNNLLIIQQEVQNNSNFFSVLYLKFAALYGNQFVNQAAIQQVATSIFGSDIDVSSYFQNSTLPVLCDLTVSSGFGQSGLQQGVDGAASGIMCGPLVRASQMGFMNNGQIDASWLISQVPYINSSDVQSFLQNIAGGTSKNSIVYDRARATELFFLYLGILMGSNMVVGAPTYDASFCSDMSCPGNSWCPVPAPCAKMSTAPFSFYSIDSQYCFAQICSKLAAAARYLTILHNTQLAKNVYKAQPVDTFYGMIVLNQSSYTIESGESRIAPGQVGVLKGSVGVDTWGANGINPESNYKYRSVICNLLKPGENKMAELRVEENFDIAHYDPSQTYVPAITILNGVAKTQRDIVAQPYMQDFFRVDPGVGWAVVLQVVEQTDTYGDSSFLLNMIGLARLNPYDFPLVYRGHGLDTLSVGAFSAEKLWQAPFMVYTKIVASQPSNTSWQLGASGPVPQFGPLGTQTLTPFTVSIPGSTTTKTITPEPVNPYYIAYQSALSADYGSKSSLQVGLQNSMNLIKKAYFTLDDLAITSLMRLIKGASADPHNIIVQITTTESYKLATS